jgi:putative PIN family toxin of toxin-antitoxin system
VADRQPRVVLDTNVLVSALIAQNRGWDTPPLRCLGLALRGEIQLITSPDLVAELLRALRYPKLRVPIERAHAFAGVVAALADPDGLVRTTGRMAVLRRDDADNLVIETALNGRAGWLVTGNIRHFAELWTPGAPPVFRDVRVVTPRQFTDGRR